MVSFFFFVKTVHDGIVPVQTVNHPAAALYRHRLRGNNQVFPCFIDAVKHPLVLYPSCKGPKMAATISAAL